MEHDFLEDSTEEDYAPDAPDFRDLTIASQSAEDLHTYLRSSDRPRVHTSIAGLMPLRRAPQLRGSAADACCSVLEYYRALCFGDTRPLSRSFVHANATMMNDAAGRKGVSLRTALKAVRRCGVPSHSLVHSVEQAGRNALDMPLCYQFNEYATDFSFYRIDLSDPDAALAQIKSLLIAKIPCLFGMSIPASTFYDRKGSDQIRQEGKIEIRGRYDGVRGMRAGVLCGFDDKMRISKCGALRFFGPFPLSWGKDGLGWISYSMLERGMVTDIWVPMSKHWLVEMAAQFVS